MAKKERPEAGVTEASMDPIGDKVGVVARREYTHTRVGTFRAGQRAALDIDDVKTIQTDHPDDPPFELVEFTPEEKAEIDKALVSPENKSLGSPETK